MCTCEHVFEYVCQCSSPSPDQPHKHAHTYPHTLTIPLATCSACCFRKHYKINSLLDIGSIRSRSIRAWRYFLFCLVLCVPRNSHSRTMDQPWSPGCAPRKHRHTELLLCVWTTSYRERVRLCCHDMCAVCERAYTHSHNSAGPRTCSPAASRLPFALCIIELTILSVFDSMTYARARATACGDLHWNKWVIYALRGTPTGHDNHDDGNHVCGKCTGRIWLSRATRRHAP